MLPRRKSRLLVRHHAVKLAQVVGAPDAKYVEVGRLRRIEVWQALSRWS
jgi:hypothetical protein